MEAYFKLKYIEEIIGYFILFLVVGLPIILIILNSIIENIKDLFKKNKGE